MAAPVRQGTLESFEKLSETASLYRPNSAQDAKSQPPILIVVCSWFGAAPKHIAKYTSGYQTLYPHATILVCQSTPYSMAFNSDLTAARSIIQSFPAGQTVLHAFSNGGATTAIQVAEHIERPFDTLILDCCPGTAELDTATRAISFAIPPAYRKFGSWVVYGMLMVYMLVVETAGWENAPAWMRRNLNDRKMFPQAERMYLFSEADDLVRSRDVRSHAAEARGKGAVVREEVFERAPHCALVQEDAERYWRLVRDFINGTGKPS